MKHRHVIGQFLEWTDNRTGDKERLEIQRHLGECDDCRRYFEKMNRLMEGVGSDALSHLEPDPFLPARIRANAEAAAAGSTAPGRKRPAFGRLAVSVLSAGVVVAAAVGIVIGNGLSSRVSANEETQAIINGYYEAFSQDEFAQEWETVLVAEEEDES
jgi:predicted anti-sigma-YlaC factor YlaD